jgi:DNA replication protein DnaC
MRLAILTEKEKKHFRLLAEEREARAAEVRRQLTEGWTFDRTRDYAAFRIKKLFPEASFKPQKDTNADVVFNLFCLYFANDPAFVIDAGAAGVENPDLRKGILLMGSIGLGKSTLMRIFAINPRQVFMIKTAADISTGWYNGNRDDKKDTGPSIIEQLSAIKLLPVNDADHFYHRHAGLCIDDIGTEDVKNSYGNRCNVIGELIEARYSNQATGIFLHLTTNLSGEQLREHYGPRVTSRLRETMNIIHLKGGDRRK